MEQQARPLTSGSNEDRPRERMMNVGAEALSNAELIAILIRTGTKKLTALDLAHQLIQQAGTLRGLLEFSLNELRQIKGIGPAKAIELKAAIELGRRIMRLEKSSNFVVRRPQDVASFVMDELRFLTKEHFVCLFLNVKNHVIGKTTLSIGTINASLVHPREVFQSAIKAGAASIICAHNHPSGDPTPSIEDIQLTSRLVQAGGIIGIDILDHIIIGDNQFISLKELGHM